MNISDLIIDKEFESVIPPLTDEEFELLKESALNDGEVYAIIIKTLGEITMIRFNNDYNRGALPSVLDALKNTSGDSFAGYGEDEWCERAKNIIKELTSPDADVRFLPGATQANFIVISAALSSVQSVIAADTGHINCHEAASIENTGHKILELQNNDGKISAEQIEKAASHYYDSGEPEYLTEPKIVYLSFPTEKGTLYSKDELSAIRDVCDKYKMYLFVDGARLSYGLASPQNDVTLKFLSETADVFYFGGTKCGLLFGEALVITAEPLKRRFKAYMKQNGAVLAKGWLLGLSFATVLGNGEYFETAKSADEKAMRIKEAFKAKGIPFAVESFTNQQFVILTDRQREDLSKNYYFEEQEKVENGTVVRFCTSWATSDSEVDALIADIAKL